VNIQAIRKALLEFESHTYGICLELVERDTVVVLGDVSDYYGDQGLGMTIHKALIVALMLTEYAKVEAVATSLRGFKLILSDVSTL
jgi:hypothetical protein